MFIYLFLNNAEYSILDNLRISSFNVISILSGTGYVTDDFGLWGEFPLIFFIFLMFIGGWWDLQHAVLKYLDYRYCFFLLETKLKN